MSKPNNKRRSSAKKPQDKRRFERRPDREEEPRGSKPWENDVSWYTRYPNLAVAAGSFPYPYRPGMSLPLGAINTTFGGATFQTSNLTKQIPGVLALEWLPSLGQSHTATDPASVMAKEIYAKVRKVYSGSLNADAPDFVIYLMALDGIFSYIGGLKRLYRVLTAWSPDNYVLPDTLLSAMGVSSNDIQTLRQDKTKLWQAINTLVLQSRKFTCPAVMDYFNRHYWMNDNVYTDAASINSQFYVFTMNGVFKYASLAMPNGDMAGGLQMVPTPWNWDMRMNSTYLTVDILYQFGRDLIDALVAWDEAYEINGYLARAFEGQPNFIVDELPIDQPFNPVYSEEVLTQIENSRTLPSTGRILYGDASKYSGFNITQDVLTNAIISDPHYTALDDTYNEIGGQGYNVKPVLSSRSDQPAVANNIIASRLQSYVKSVSGMTVYVQCASEIALRWTMFEGVRNLNMAITEVPQQPVALSISNNVSGKLERSDNGVAAKLAYMDDLAMFDWHPFVFFVSGSQAQNAGVAAGTSWAVKIMGDIHNVTTVTLDDIVNLHTICLYSELNSFSVN